MAEEIKRVCVIGAGASGLPAIKVCLEDGLEVVCFERSEDIGGLWRFTTEVDGKACCMKSTVINTSKEIQAFSDFPPEKSLPNYMHNTALVSYFRAYAEHNDLLKHIRFRTEIRQCEPISSSKLTKWRVTYVELGADGNKSAQNSTKTEIFDAILLCTGHHSTPNLPTFEGMEDFKGEVIHSHAIRDYLCSNKFTNKRVVVIGIGNSGLDVANEVSQVTSKTFLVGRRGAWVLSRYSSGGLPTDFALATRFVDAFSSVMGFKISNWLVRRQIESNFDHSLFGLRPESEPMSDHPYVSDGLLNALQTGRVDFIRSGIRRFTARSVEFSNGKVVDDVDFVLMCTGYRIQVPILSEKVFQVEDNRLPLYKRCVHPDYHSLVFVGYIQPFGPIIPISEMQSRFACSLWRHRFSLPGKNEIYREIREYDEWMKRRFVTSLRHTIEVDLIPYLDALAEPMGVKPKLTKLLLTDPALYTKVMFEGCTPYQYRLNGPNSWSGAREAIMTQRDRIEFACAPLVHQAKIQSAPTPTAARKSSFSSILLRAFAIATFAYLITLYSRYNSIRSRLV